jgi:hypothetical protein
VKFGLLLNDETDGLTDIYTTGEVEAEIKDRRSH